MKNTILIFFAFLATVALGMSEALSQFDWKKDTNPVLSGGGAGAWNQYVFNPCVLYDADSSRYEMWFGACTGTAQRPWRVGFAASKDRITWTMYPTPVLSPDPGTWDQHTVEAQSVLRENGHYKMWYTSYLSATSPSSIGYATSTDGIHWTKHLGNPVMGPGTSAWEAFGPYSSAVSLESGKYKMWFGAYDTSNSVSKGIGYATSADGIIWVKDTVHNPVLSTGAPGKWDDYSVGQPAILNIRAKYYLWYQGSHNAENINRSGLAISSDGITNWVR